MPAAVYWFGGLALAHGSHAVSVPTLVAFTTLQTRLFFPVGSLLGVGLDVQTSLALFDRIFDYLDQTVDIEERPGATTLGAAGDVVFDGVWFRYGEDTWTLRDVSFTVPAGSKTALVGETGSGKTTLGYLAARLYDVDRGGVSIGGVDLRNLTFASLASIVGVVSQETYLFHASVRDNLRFAKPNATDEELDRGGRGGPDPRADRVAAGGLRHRRRRARLPLLRRREAAHRDRADGPPQPADPRARRGDERARHGDGASGAGGARPARGRAHDDRDRAPHLDGRRRRPDPRPRPAARSSSAARTTSCSRWAAATRSSSVAQVRATGSRHSVCDVAGDAARPLGREHQAMQGRRSRS